MEFCLNISENNNFLSHFGTGFAFPHLKKLRFCNLFVGIVLAKLSQIKYLSKLLNIEEFFVD